jgi:iron complex outermembrane recepter protein
MKHIIFTFLSFFILVSGYSQAISGVVTDGKNEPIIGATVVEKGTVNGTTTDLDGKFALTTTTSEPVIIISYTGYTTAEQAVGNLTSLNIILDEELILNEIQVVGSRSYNRSATESPAAIDVIDIADIANTTGRTEVNQVMQYTAPSFNSTKQSGSDGADHIDPASLRGLGPDQTLVLVNGKRRHQSSLVNLFGTRGRGNTGTDLNAIPAAAIKRIEVLRDGASAQYGSDAIAGVINIVLKDKTKGLSGGVTYGAFSTNVGKGYAEKLGEDIANVEGKNRVLDTDGDKSYDGNTARIDLNYGVGIGDKGGFANFTAEYLTKDRTLRPGYPWRLGYGSAGANQLQFMLNSALPLGEHTSFYLFGGTGQRATDAFAYTRDAAGVDGDDRTVAALYPNGFTPHITSKIQDNAATAGVNHDFSNGFKANFSHTYGFNDFLYTIKGTNNASLGAKSPTSFNAGGHNLGMNTTNFDLSKYYDEIGSGLNIAFGAEHRFERFKIIAGEEGSYATYDKSGKAITNPATQQVFENEFGQQAPGGSQGFPGYSPANEVNKTRSNIALYGDAEFNASEAFLITSALRFEKYSDFGSTFNYKLASRYKINDGLSLRASLSSGFRAPSLAQIHYNLIFTNIVAGASLQTLLASNTSAVARAFGIKPLKQETAQNIAAGFTYKNAGFTATVDAYSIGVKDRIVLTDVFDATSLNVGAEAAQFFANGLDTKTTGVDLILNYKKVINSGKAAVNFGVAGNVNNTDIVKIKNGNLNQFTFFGPFSQAYVKAAAPKYKVGLTAGLDLNKFDAQLTYTQFSDVTLQDFQWIDTPATTQAEADELYKNASDLYKAAGTLDLSVGYNISSKLKISIGANNLLNKYPTPQFDGWTDQGGFNDSVQMGSDGRYVFTRVGFNF